MGNNNSSENPSGNHIYLNPKLTALSKTQPPKPTFDSSRDDDWDESTMSKLRPDLSRNGDRKEPQMPKLTPDLSRNGNWEEPQMPKLTPDLRRNGDWKEPQMQPPKPKPDLSHDDDWEEPQMQPAKPELSSNRKKYLKYKKKYLNIKLNI